MRYPRAGAAAAVLLFVAGAALRLFLAWTTPASHDIESYEIVAQILMRGDPLYEITERYNYSPVWSWALAGIDHVARAAGIRFEALVRTLLTAVDLLTAAALFRLAGRTTGAVSPVTAAALFLANPVSIWVSSVQGQFDNVSVLLLLLAILSSSRARERGVAAALWLSLSIAIKQVTAFHPLIWLRRPSERVAGWLPYVAVAALFLPYAGQWRAIRDRVLLYRSVPQSYGLSEFVLWDSRCALPLAALAVMAAIAAACLLPTRDLVRSSLLLFLVLLFFAPGIGHQYLVWPVALGALFGGPRYLLFTAAATLWILGSHYEMRGSGQFMGQLVWLVVALWGVGEIGRLRRRRPSDGPHSSLQWKTEPGDAND